MSDIPIDDITAEDVAQLSTGILLDLLVSGTMGRTGDVLALMMNPRVPSTVIAMARNELARRIDGDEVPAETGPPCPRCGEPMFKVQDAPDSAEFAWGHDCEPETFSDMAPGWRL
jgi:hypothetical protein